MADARRKCLSWASFSEITAQDASNIARKTPNVSFFVRVQTAFYGYKVEIDDGELAVESLPGWKNLPFGPYLGSYLKALAKANDDLMQ
jgi:hypothetical protein